MGKLNFEKTPIEGVYIITPNAFEDDRGFFARMFSRGEFEAHGLNAVIEDINHSRTIGKGTVRGLHYQLPPFAEDKMVRCIRGRILDVAVDIRRNSPTFMDYVGVELSEEGRNMLYVPRGCAHGFQSLEEDIEMVYAVTNSYSSEHERGVRYNDSRVGIDWPLDVANASEKDKNHPFLMKDFEGVVL